MVSVKVYSTFVDQFYRFTTAVLSSLYLLGVNNKIGNYRAKFFASAYFDCSERSLLSVKLYRKNFERRNGVGCDGVPLLKSYQ